MILVRPSYKILMCYPDIRLIESIGRTCYKSEDKITSDSAEKFIRNIMKNGHESVIEHSILTVKFIIDRGVSHELVRHRLCAFSQESTRYCNYSGGVTFVIPPWFVVEEGSYDFNTMTMKCDTESGIFHWINSLWNAENNYLDLLKKGHSPQMARAVLPNSLKTEIVVSANYREWRHIFKLRTSPKAHPQMQEIMIPLHNELKTLLPEVFE